MKSQNSIMSKFVFVAALFVATFSNLNAQNAVIRTEEPTLAFIRYVGKERDLLVFDVHYSYTTEGRFRILDQIGQVMFEEKVQPNATPKRFKIVSDVAAKIHFDFTTKTQSQRKTFTVAYQVEETVLVREVK